MIKINRKYQLSISLVIIYSILSIIAISIFVSLVLFYTSLPIVGIDNVSKTCVYVEQRAIRQTCDGALPEKYITVWVNREIYLEGKRK